MPEAAATTLVDHVRRLTQVAAANGADQVWLAEAADDLVEALLELQARRRGDFDPRRRRTLEKARRVAATSEAMVAAGMPASERIKALRERFSISAPTVHRLIETARESHDITRLRGDKVAS